MLGPCHALDPITGCMTCKDMQATGVGGGWLKHIKLPRPYEMLLNPIIFNVKSSAYLFRSVCT